MQSIGERIKFVRDMARLDQETFGKSIGATRNTVYRWESGKGFPPADVLLNLHEKHGINIHWLVTGQGEMRGIDGPLQPLGIRELNAEVLQPVILGVEEGLGRHGIKLDSSKKARLICLLYEYATETGKQVEAELVDKYLELIA